MQNITLKKSIDIQVFEIQSSYLKNAAHLPFLSILQLAAENDGFINKQHLHKKLLYPLPLPACENLLLRLKELKYFEQISDMDKFLRLTEFGKECVEEKKIFTPQQGLLKFTSPKAHLYRNIL